MKLSPEDTPPSSIDGDEIGSMDEELIYIGDADEILGEEGDIEDENSEFGEGESDSESEPIKDDSTMLFDKHEGSAFCGSFHPTGKFAVTGGQDDKAYVWHVDSGQIITECTGHKDSIIFASFSFDGAYLATADMSGIIQVWKCNLDDNQTAPWVKSWDYEAGDLIWGQWHSGARVLVCGSSGGEVYVFKIPSGDTKVLEGHNVKAECGTLFPDGRRMVVGYEDGSMKIWDLKSASALHYILSHNGHSSAITSIDVHSDNNLVISVASDGKIILTTATLGKRVACIETETELEAVAFCKEPDTGFFASATLDGNVSIWDTSRLLLRHQCSKSDSNHSAGVTKMFWIKGHLVTACLDGCIRIYDGKTGKLERTLTGHNSEILDINYLSHQNALLTTSDDGDARIFKLDLSNSE